MLQRLRCVQIFLKLTKLRLNLVLPYGIPPETARSYRRREVIQLFTEKSERAYECRPSEHPPVRGKQLLLFLTSSVLVANPKKTTLHGGQSRSWSAEQRKENKRSLAAYPPPPPTLLVRRKKNITRRIYRRYAGLGRSRVPYVNLCNAFYGSNSIVSNIIYLVGLSIKDCLVV